MNSLHTNELPPHHPVVLGYVPPMYVPTLSYAKNSCRLRRNSVIRCLPAKKSIVSLTIESKNMFE